MIINVHDDSDPAPLGASPSRADATARATELPAGVRRRIEAEAGLFARAEQVGAGHNCLAALIVHTTAGSWFIKGIHADHARAVWNQSNEAAINPYVEAVTAPLEFRVQADGWDNRLQRPAALEARGHRPGRREGRRPGRCPIRNLPAARSGGAVETGGRPPCAAGRGGASRIIR